MFSARCKRLLAVFSALLAFGYAVQLFWVHNRMDPLCVMEGVASVYSPGYRKLLAAAAAGNAPEHRAAQARLLYDYSFDPGGRCVPYDNSRLFDFLEETAAAGWAESQYVAAFHVMGRNHYGVWPRSMVPDSRQDMPLSFHYLQEAAAKGVKNAQHDLSIAYAIGKWGDSYLSEPGGHNDPMRALRSRTDKYRDAERGPDVMTVAIDYAKSIAWLENAAAEKGGEDIVIGQRRFSFAIAPAIDLAQRYRYGRYGAPQDSERAFALFSRLVNGKRYPEPRAAAELALMYAKGAGVAQDMEKARRLMESAVDAADEGQKAYFEQLAAIASERLQ